MAHTVHDAVVAARNSKDELKNAHTKFTPFFISFSPSFVSRKIQRRNHTHTYRLGYEANECAVYGGSIESVRCFAVPYAYLTLFPTLTNTWTLRFANAYAHNSQTQRDFCIFFYFFSHFIRAVVAHKT